MSEQAFPNYLQTTPLLPSPVWWGFRILSLLLTIAVIATLFVAPELGLVLVWQILIPLLPLTFAVMPGVWRNICPMALLNQLPRTFGFSREATLSNYARRLFLYLSIFAFIAFVLLRKPLFNESGAALGLIFTLALIAAFVGGFWFKGRSGWCGTLCPLAPLQKAYGHAPLLLVRNGYCDTCVGCQKNCYDFNPRAAIFSDLNDSEQWWSEQRIFFTAMLPGLIYAFFTTTYQPAAGVAIYLWSMAAPVLTTLGSFYLLRNLLQINFYRLASVYALTALALFYWFGLPVVADGLAVLSGWAMPTMLVDGLRYAVVGVSLAVFARGLWSEQAFRQSRQSAAHASIGGGVKTLQDAMRQTASLVSVREQASGENFVLKPGQSLLDGLEANELPIMSGCRMGMCGSDPVVITEGHDNLDPPDENELNTLKRLGLEGRARLACCCRPKAGIALDLQADPTEFEAPLEQKPVSTSEPGVVIIGNGIAGVSTAEHIRELDAQLPITLITQEPYHFYNRMGLEAVIHGKTAMQNLYLMKEDWYQRNQINFWLNTLVQGIDRDQHRIELATGETLAYTSLVLATGANAFIPPAACYQQPGVYGLRSAEDALGIRAYVQQHQARRAVVLGGGVLGIEAADALHQLGLRVTLIHAAPSLMNRQLDLRAAVILKNFLHNRGIRVLTGCSIEDVVDHSGQKEVLLDNGKSLVCDLVLLCIGIRANTDLASSAGLETNRGVLVNEFMQTSDPDIYCVGDAAEMPGAIGGLWSVGNTQGQIAAASICDQARAFEAAALPPVQLKIAGIDLKCFGSFDDDQPGESVTLDQSSSQRWRHLRVHQGRIIAGVFVNATQSANAVIAAVKNPDARFTDDEISNLLEQDPVVADTASAG